MDYEDEKEKLEELYILYAKRLFYIANDILKDEDLAKDAVHNTFLKLIRSDLLNKIEKVKSYAAKGYLIKATRNIAINMLAKQKREQKFIQKEYNMLLFQHEGNMQEVYNRLSLEELTATIKKLPEKYRSVLTLRYFYQCTDKEIAVINEIKVELVRKWIERAKKRLKEQYKKDYPDEYK